MSITPADVAIAVLQDTQKQVLDYLKERNVSPAESSEVVRILALNRAFDAWRDNQPTEADDLKLKALSPTGFRNHANSDSVVSMATEQYSRLSDLHVLDSVQNLNSLGAIDVLGAIHSIGSHTISPRGFSVKRLLGAFYTPSDVALFIAARAIKPVLNRIISNTENDLKNVLEIVRKWRFLDPCCGPGVFLICAFEVIRNVLTERFGEDNQSLFPEIRKCLISIVGRLYGIDIDPAALEIARFCLNYLSDDSKSNTANEIRAASLYTGNSIISLLGLVGQKDHSSFFASAHLRHPFEWTRELGDVLKEEGFDFVLFNPPYERLKPNLSEFMRGNLQTGGFLINLNEYDNYKNLLSEDVSYFRKSGEFKYSTSNSINTYQLFIERALQVTKPNGKIGFIVPSTLLGDFSSRNLRQHLLNQNTIQSVESFTEAAGLFPGVTQSVCITILEKGGKTQVFRFSPKLNSLQAAFKNSGYNLSADNLNLVFGQTLSIPSVEPKDWEILRKIHRHPILSSFEWISNRRGELDLTIDKHFLNDREVNINLIRGSDIGRYHLLPESTRHARRYVDIKSFRKAKMKSKRILHIKRKRIACQQITNQANRWRLKFCGIESDTVLANSCNYISIDSNSETSLLDFLLALLNSELLNWRFSITSTNNHVSNREMASLPIVNPLEESNAELISEIVKNVREIERPTPDIVPKIEAQVFCLYGLSMNEARRVLRNRNASPHETERILSYF